MNNNAVNRPAILLLTILISLATVAAGGEEPLDSQPAEQVQAGPTSADVVLVTGAAGEEAFGEAFTQWASRWREVAQQSGAAVHWIGPGSNAAAADEQSTPSDSSQSDAGVNDTASPASEPPSSSDPPTDRQRLHNALAALTRDAPEPLWIVLIGHGTFSQNTAKFNLQGPDLTAADLAQWLQPFSRPLVVINASSSSGPFVNALSAEGHVIVTATRSGNEQNYARFGQYLAAAIGDERADIDHDGEVSILEAFLAASAEVRDFYRSSGRIATEHALLDDNGDALGTPATAFRGTRVVAAAEDPQRSPDGELAARITLAPAAQRLPFTEQELAERDEVEAELARLRAERAQMNAAEYQAAVLPHLVRLARLYAAAEARSDQAQ